ncbi:MAG: hypothetical protein HOV96_31270 [Nonomuraea sp.]|nr:hypothetical protein [Nonomuraea sp.]
MTRTRRVGTAIALAAVVCAGSGCTVIPVSGPYTVNDAGGGDPLNKPFQRMIAVPPLGSWDPDQLIRGLQSAMAAYPDDPTVLAKYLTPKAQAKWKPSGPVTVIEDTFQVSPTERGAEQQYVLKAKQIARIDPDDAYVPLSGNAPELSFVLKKDGGVYRVDELRDGLVLTKSDVARAYRLTNLYYLNNARDRRLVVDRVCLRLKPTESFAQTIVKRLLKEPSAALRGAVGTGFPPGTEVESVGTGEDRVVINFSGPLASLDLSEKSALVAQLRYSLTNNKVANSRTIELQLDGEPYWTEPPNPETRWLDNGGSTPFYTSKGVVHVMSNEGAGVAVSGPAGEANPDFSAFALSRQESALIAARTSTGISVAGLTPEGRWQQVVEGTELTDPTWHRDGSLWTFDKHNHMVLRYSPTGGRGPERVSAPGLDGLDVTALKIARDGVRVALRTGKNTVQLGALSEGLNGPVLGNLQTLTSTEVEYKIEDIAWEDDEHLLVLIRSKAGQILNEIDVGDGGTVGIPLKDQLERVTALNGRVLAEARTDKGPKIIELNPDRQGWTSKIEPNAKNPFFPLG